MKEEKDLINKILKRIHRIRPIEPESFPNLELYMDQVTRFMDSRLSSARRYEEDKILTKTMINNYAKNRLLPSPEKKRYSRDHLLILVFIYYFKSFLSIRDIQALLGPLTVNHFHERSGKSILSIYQKIFDLENQEMKSFDQKIQKVYTRIQDAFGDEDDKDQAFLRKFALISVLSYDIYMKKALIEQIIDDLPDRKTTKTGKAPGQR